jgi:hypothetical protein
MSDYAIKIVGLVNGRPTLAEGQYVADYTPSGYEGRGDLVLTPYPSRAKRFPSMAAATDCWRSTSRTHPVRPDGKPNRPMTAWTVEIARL